MIIYNLNFPTKFHLDVKRNKYILGGLFLMVFNYFLLLLKDIIHLHYFIKLTFNMTLLLKGTKFKTFLILQL
jgi:hypothetical protein